MIPGPCKWHGGKAYLAQRIIALMPERCKNPNKPSADDPGWLHYVEPYAGGLSVLLANDPEGISEVVNDLNQELTNFWNVLQSWKLFPQFQRLIEAVPFSEVEWDYAVLERAWYQNGDLGSSPFPEDASFELEAALCFFVRCRQSLAGRMKSFTGVTKTRTRRGMNNEVSAWLTAVEGLPAVHARLKRVLILNRPAVEVIKAHDGPRTLHYCDPPYCHETRATTSEYGPHEMSAAQHEELCKALVNCQGKVLLSGYRSQLYDDLLMGWKRHDFEIANHAAGGATKRRMVESVYVNY